MQTPKAVGDYKPQPLSSGEVDSILDRISEMSSTVREVLNTDPKEIERIREEREKQRREEKRKIEKERNFNRYNPSQYRRLEDDKFIEKLLKQVDEPPPALYKKQTDLTNVETISLREAERLKKDGNAHFAKQQFEDAFDRYSNAINLEPQDQELVVALHNNRAMVALKLDKWIQTIEDTGFVLQHEKHNVKALLRRATALIQLHRPDEAIEVCNRVLKAESKNAEVKGLLKKAQEAQQELVEYTNVFGDYLRRAQVAAGPSTPQEMSNNNSSKPSSNIELAEDIDEIATKLLDLIDRLLGKKDEEKEVNKNASPIVAEDEDGKGGAVAKERLSSSQAADMSNLTETCNTICELTALVGSVYVAGVQLRVRDSRTIPRLLDLIPFCEDLLGTLSSLSSAGHEEDKSPSSSSSSSVQRKKQKSDDISSANNRDAELVTRLVFIAATYKLLSSVYQHLVARSMLEQMQGGKLHRDVINSVLRVARSAVAADRPVVVPAALDLLSNLCRTSKSRQVVIGELSAKLMSIFLNGKPGKSGTSPQGQAAAPNRLAALRLLEKLFLEPSGSSKYASCVSGGGGGGGGAEMLTSLLDTLKSGSVPEREAATPMLLRLSADSEFVAKMCGVGSATEVAADPSKLDFSRFEVIAGAIKQEMHEALEKCVFKPEELGTATRGFILEGLLAILFNALRNSQQVRLELSKVLFKELLHARFLTYLEAFCKVPSSSSSTSSSSSVPFTGVHPRDELWNVVSRMTSVMSKMTALSDVKDYWVSNRTHGGIVPLLQLLTLSCKYLSASESSSSSSSSRRRGEKEEKERISAELTATDEQYKSTSAENVTMILATICREADGIMTLWTVLAENSSSSTRTNGSARTPSPQDLIKLLKFDLHSNNTSSNARTVGNGALLVPVLNADTIDPKITVAGCLESIKDLRSRAHQLESAIATAEAQLKGIQSKALAGGEGSPSEDDVAAAKEEVSLLSTEKKEVAAAMKNIGIALSKLAKVKDGVFLQELREQRGIEILATAMKFETK